MGKIARVFLVRHGTSVSNDRSVYSSDAAEGLNEQGRREAQSLTATFATVRVNVVMSSPFARAIQTAEPLAASKKLRTEVDERLSELVIGPWAGMKSSDIELNYPEEWTSWRQRPESLQLPGREDLQSLRIRVAEAFEDLVSRGQDVTVVVTHDANIRVLVAHALGVSNAIYRSIPIANSSISLISSTGREHELHLLNSCAHLRDLQ